MQEDMHYYGTYAMARAAGLVAKDAKIVAYASQYVDDATLNDGEAHEDGGMFQTIATAHTSTSVIANAIADPVEQRNVWVPFHFYPGNEGETISERLACVKDGKPAREMVANHIRHAAKVKDEYGLALMGIMAHVYADTFSHYGFSGVSSRNNKVDSDSFQLDVKDIRVRAYIMNKFSGFMNKYSPSFLIKNYRRFASQSVETVTGALGHGAAGTYPDRPYLKWKFTFEKDGRSSGWRDNQATFVEACEKLHGAFNTFAVKAEIAVNPVPFSEIKETVTEILALERAMDGRTDAWKKAIRSGRLFQPEEKEALRYSKDEWEDQKEGFPHLDKSQEIIKQEVYRYHQAAVYHRDYTLKQLLPRYGLNVV